MSELLLELLVQYGPTAMAIGATYFGLGYAIFVLWKRNQELQNGPQLAELVQSFKDVRAEAEAQRETFEDELKKLRDEFKIRLQSLQEARIRAAEEYARKVDELHEKRLADKAALVREALEHISASQRTAERIGDAIEGMRDLLKR